MEKSAHRCAMAKRALERHLQGQGLTKREALSNFNQGRDEPEEDLEMDR